MKTVKELNLASVPCMKIGWASPFDEAILTLYQRYSYGLAVVDDRGCLVASFSLKDLACIKLRILKNLPWTVEEFLSKESVGILISIFRFG